MPSQYKSNQVWHKFGVDVILWGHLIHINHFGSLFVWLVNMKLLWYEHIVIFLHVLTLQKYFGLLLVTFSPCELEVTMVWAQWHFGLLLMTFFTLWAWSYHGVSTMAFGSTSCDIFTLWAWSYYGMNTMAFWSTSCDIFHLVSLRLLWCEHNGILVYFLWHF